MDTSLSSILAMIRLTFQDPRAAARYLIALQLPPVGRWLLFGLVVTASALLTHLSFGLLPPEEMAFLNQTMSNPLQTAALQAGFLLVTIVAIFGIGRWQGGKGSFADTLFLLGWLQVVLLSIQVAQIVALATIPPVAEILGVVGLAVSFWILTQFIVELHGFKSAWRVFLAIVGAIFLLALALSALLVSVYGAGALGNV